jgi:Family of unknown function (DUF6502)
MSALTRTRRSTSREPKRRGKSTPRLDRTARWSDLLDHLAWILRRAGVSPEDLSTEFAKCVKRHENLESLSPPTAEVLEYTRVLTRWVTDPTFVDEKGKPRVLALKGPGSFAALVRHAVPEGKAAHVLQTLERCGMIRRTGEGRIEAVSTCFLPEKGKNDAHILGYALQGIEAMMASVRANLASAEPKSERSQFLRLVLAERFDMKYLRQYDVFSKASASKELAKYDQWFRRHEAKGKKSRKGEVGRVGMGILVFNVER